MIDLSPIIVGMFVTNDGVHEFIKPISFFPRAVDGTENLFRIQHWFFGIEVYGHSREQLLRELDECIRCNWGECAMEEDDRLTPKAIKLKQRWLAAVKEQ
jgi:hypothetical protein